MTERTPEKVDKERGYAALHELEALRVATVSQASHWPRITIQIQQGGKDEKRIVELGVNGRRYEIMRGSRVAVPPEVVDVLTEAIQGVVQEVPLDHSVGNRHETVDVPRFPFFIVDAVSQERYELWQQAKRARTHMHANPPKDDGSREMQERIVRWKQECDRTRDADMALAMKILDRVKAMKQAEEEERARLREAAAA